jgi:hypothetical protein
MGADAGWRCSEVVVDPLHDAAALLGLAQAQCGYDVPLAATQYGEEAWRRRCSALRTRSSPSSVTSTPCDRANWSASVTVTAEASTSGAFQLPEQKRSSRLNRRRALLHQKTRNLGLIPLGRHSPRKRRAVAAKKRGPQNLRPMRPQHRSLVYLTVRSIAYRRTQKPRGCVLPASRPRLVCVPARRSGLPASLCFDLPWSTTACRFGTNGTMGTQICSRPRTQT